jgi:hypothetical protein
MPKRMTKRQSIRSATTMEIMLRMRGRCPRVAMAVGNADTGFPLPYSTVTIEGPVDQEVETDYDGRYAIFGLTPGAYMVTASHMGCKNGYYTFVQSDIEFRTRNFMLDPIRPGPIPYKMQRT